MHLRHTSYRSQDVEDRRGVFRQPVCWQKAVPLQPSRAIISADDRFRFDPGFTMDCFHDTVIDPADSNGAIA